MSVMAARRRKRGPRWLDADETTEVVVGLGCKSFISPFAGGEPVPFCPPRGLFRATLLSEQHGLDLRQRANYQARVQIDLSGVRLNLKHGQAGDIAFRRVPLRLMRNGRTFPSARSLRSLLPWSLSRAASCCRHRRVHIGALLY